MPNVLTRQEAIELNLPRFFTGLQCSNGHVAERITKSYRCVECKREWESRRRITHAEQDKAIRAREVRKNAESYKRRRQEYDQRKGKSHVSELQKKWKLYNKDKVLENTNHRRALKQQASPIWRDAEACKMIYRRAIQLTRETGILHHVDHIVPLNGVNVCGLHCEYNLQILTAEENLKKSNVYP